VAGAPQRSLLNWHEQISQLEANFSLGGADPIADRTPEGLATSKTTDVQRSPQSSS
jgi:hypothetical protein